MERLHIKLLKDYAKYIISGILASIILIIIIIVIVKTNDNNSEIVKENTIKTNTDIETTLQTAIESTVETTTETQKETQTEVFSETQSEIKNTTKVVESEVTSQNGDVIGTTVEVTTEKESIVIDTEVKYNSSGVLIPENSYGFIKSQIDNKIQPVLHTYEVLTSSSYSNPFPTNYWDFPRAVETVIRGGSGDNVARLYIDVARAYQCALLWRINGSVHHGNTAANILNAWSKTLKSIGGNADRYLASGLFGYQLANISYMMKDHPLFQKEDMKNMLLNVFYPMNERFLVGNEWGKDHNDAYISNYWANWDLCNMASVMAIGIYTENKEIYNQAVDYFKYGNGNGSIYNAIPFIHNNNLAQWQESGRDQGHSLLGIGLMASVCEMAWNQGDDLYGWANNRFLMAAEYVARYNNGHDVDFSVYEWGSGTKGTIMQQAFVSGLGRGEIRPIWAMIYNHYVNRMKLNAPNISERLNAVVYEFGAGGHATTFDQPGFGTLIYTNNIGNMVVRKNTGNILDGNYRIKSVFNGKVLAAGSGNVLVQQDIGFSNSQIWKLTHISGGEYKITNTLNNLAIEVENGLHINGAAIKLNTDTNELKQRFAFLNNGNNYRIIGAISGKALDVKDWSVYNNTEIIQWRYTLNNNQQWILEKVN